jgi:Tfp pilus assembly protein PilF
MSRIIRFAICQLTCHPAIYSAHHMWLEEPFLHQDTKVSLSHLSLKGFGVKALFDYCKTKYLNWQRDRLKGIFDFLYSIDPYPDIIIFPEGSIPFQCLDLVKNFHEISNATIFAGTHTLQNLRESKRAYSSMGLGDKSIKRLFYKNGQINGVVPIFIDQKVHLLPKQILSPFEKTDITSFHVQEKPVFPLRMQLEDNKAFVLPLICAEALNFTNIKIRGDYEIVSVLSYDRKPENFRSVIDLLVANKRVVVYCNDGIYGGSGIYLPIDERQPNWLYESNLDGKLPKGESLLIADVDLANLPIQVGTAQPSTNFRLVKLSSIVYKEDKDSCYISMNIKDIEEIPDCESKSQKIHELIESGNCDQLQSEKYNFLSKVISKGQNVDEWWSVLGNDLIINIPSLKQLEANMSRQCFTDLSTNLLDYESSKDGFDKLREFLKYAKFISEQYDPYKDKSDTVLKTKTSIIDRDEDAKSLVTFFDDSNLKVAIISGFQQIGKSAVIEKALQLLRYSNIVEISIHETTSADYVIKKLFYNPPFDLEFDSKPLIDQLKPDDVIYLLNTIDVLWIHNSENFITYGNWKNNETKKLIYLLLNGCIKSKCKLIFESRIYIPIETSDPNSIFRKRIYGMERRMKDHGVTYFEYQLRRVGLSPNDIGSDLKYLFVERLGGHPYALALCADAIVDDGISAVIDFLKTKKGFYLNFVSGILNKISLNRDEKLILNLLSGCRSSIPREIILESFDYVVNPYLKNLINLSLIEVGSKSFIRLPGLLKRFFDINEVNPDLQNKFHSVCGDTLRRLYKNDKSKFEYAIESDVHNLLAGKSSILSKGLLDGQFEAAKRYYDNQNFKKSKLLLDKIPDELKTHDIMRLSAIVDAKCNQFNDSIRKAKMVFAKNRFDTYLLSQISRISLSQGRDDIAEDIIATAQAANMEDTSILIVSGRMLLRRNDLQNAEDKFLSALQKTKRNPWPFFYLGRIYMRLGEFDKAIDILYDGEQFIYNNNIRNERALAAIRTQLGIAYLLDDNLDLAEQTIKGLYSERKKDPEVIRAYALITIKKEGIEKAFEAFQKLSEVKIRSRFDRAQFHLYYGIFYLGVGDKGNASIEFTKAHAADKNNVYIMMKLAKTYYDMAIEGHIDGETDISQGYANDCALIVKKILEFDSDNQTAIDLQIDIYHNFKIEVSKI